MLGTTTFTPEHVCKISFRLLNIFEKLWHGERTALDREEEEKQNKFNPLLLVTVYAEQLMTLIWSFRVTQGQTDCAIRFAIYRLLL